MSYFSGAGIEFFVLIAFCAPFNFVYLPLSLAIFVRKIYNRKHDRKKIRRSGRRTPCQSKTETFSKANANPSQ